MKQLVLLALLLCTRAEAASITFDGASSGGALGVQTSATFPHTIGAGVGGVLLVQVFTDDSMAVSSMTFNGATMLLATQNLGLARPGIETYFIYSPDVGTHNVVVNLSGPTVTYLVCLSVSYLGVDVLNGLSQSRYVAAGTSNFVNVTVTTHLADSWVVTAAMNGNDDMDGYPVASVDRVSLSAAGAHFDQRDTDVASPSAYQALYSTSSGSLPSWIESGIEMQPIPPTATSTITKTSTPTSTRTITQTNTPTPTVTITPSITPTFTFTRTSTISPTFSVSPTFTRTRTITATFSASPTPSATPTLTPACTSTGNTGVFTYGYTACPMLVGNQITVKNFFNRATFAVYLTGVPGGANVQAALYSGTWKPDQRILVSAITSAGNGWNYMTATASMVSPGSYWLLFEGSSSQMRAPRDSDDAKAFVQSPVTSFGNMPPHVNGGVFLNRGKYSAYISTCNF